MRNMYCGADWSTLIGREGRDRALITRACAERSLYRRPYAIKNQRGSRMIKISDDQDLGPGVLHSAVGRYEHHAAVGETILHVLSRDGQNKVQKKGNQHLQHS